MMFPHTVARTGIDARFTRKEFHVLSLLTQRAGGLVTYKRLRAHGLGAGSHQRYPLPSHRYRPNPRAIGDDAGYPKFIVADPDVGYRLTG